MVGQTRFYWEALKHSLPKMGLDTIEIPSHLVSLKNVFSLYEVPPYNSGIGLSTITESKRDFMNEHARE